MIDDTPPVPARRWYDLCHLSVNFYFSVFHSYRVLTGWRMPASGPVLILANHASYLDPPVIGGALPRHIFYLARRSLFRNPLFRRLIRRRYAGFSIGRNAATFAPVPASSRTWAERNENDPTES